MSLKLSMANKKWISEKYKFLEYSGWEYMMRCAIWYHFSRFSNCTTGIKSQHITYRPINRPVPNLMLFQIFLFGLYLRKFVNNLVIYLEKKIKLKKL